MKLHDKISKSAWNLFEGTKDAVALNVTNAVRDGQLKIEANQMERLLAVLAASADEGYHRGHKSFMRSVEQCFDVATKEVELDAQTSFELKKKRP